MSIRRIPPNTDQAPGQPLHDPRLSWSARGLHAYLMSLPQEQPVSLDTLVRDTAQAIRQPTGRAGVRAILDELRATGYLRRTQARTAEGVFGAVTYEIIDPRTPPLPEASPALDGAPEPAQPIDKPAPPKKKSAAPRQFGLSQMRQDNPHHLPEAVLRDYLRQRSKNPLTETAWRNLNHELGRIAEAGYSPEEAMVVAITAGWRSVRLDWVKQRLKPLAEQGAPYEQLLVLYAQRCPRLPKVSLLDDTLRTLMDERWFEHPAQQQLAFWEAFFSTANTHPPLLFRGIKQQPHLEALLTRSIFRAIVEGRHYA